MDGHRPRRRQHDRLGGVPAPELAGFLRRHQHRRLAAHHGRGGAAGPGLRPARPGLPQTGGPYAYSRKAFGDFVGFQTAWGYWIAIWAGNAAIAVAFVSYLSVFWGALATNALLAAAVAVAAIWALTAVNALGVRHGGWVQAVTTVLKLVPLLAIATVGLLFFDGGNFGPFNPAGGSVFGSVTAAAALTLWAFIGLESATVPAEDVADPKRTIPRSTIIGTLVTALVYILGTVAVMGVIPAGVLAGSNAPVRRRGHRDVRRLGR